MKRLLLFVMLFPLFTKGQTIPKEANQIIINTTKSFVDIKSLLADKGIEVLVADTEIGQIKTGTVKISKYGANGYFIIRLKEGKVYLSGFYRTGIEMSFGGIKDNDPYQQISNRKLAVPKMAWEKMIEFGKEIGTIEEYKII